MKKTELDRIDALLEETEAMVAKRRQEMDAEYTAHTAKMQQDLVEAEKVKLQRIADLEIVIEEKQKVIKETEEKIHQTEAEVRKAKQAEIDKIDAMIESHREDVEREKKGLAQAVADYRSQKASEMASLDAEIAAKKQSISHIDADIEYRQGELRSIEVDIKNAHSRFVDTCKQIENEYEQRKAAAEQRLNNELEAVKTLATIKNEEALAEHQEKINMEMEEVNKAFTAEKRRLSKEFEAYKKEMIEQRAAVEMEYGVTYTFNEKDFFTGRSLATRCHPIMVYSPVPGTGNSTLALNLATALAMNHKKVMYVELNYQHPTLKEHLGISLMKDSLDTAFQALRVKAFDNIDQNIITKQKILNLKTSAFDMQARYPDMLSYMSYTEGVTKVQDIDINFIQGLVAYLRYKKHYEYIIFDVPSYFDKKFVNDLYNLCTKHIVSTNQDILSLNNIINMKDYIQNLTALDNTYYVVNKYTENNTVLSNRKIGEICHIKTPAVLPMLCNDAIVASYKSVPLILISQSREMVTAYKNMIDYIVR